MAPRSIFHLLETDRVILDHRHQDDEGEMLLGHRLIPAQPQVDEEDEDDDEWGDHHQEEVRVEIEEEEPTAQPDPDNVSFYTAFEVPTEEGVEQQQPATSHY